jgi:hypothetical protein
MAKNTLSLEVNRLLGEALLDEGARRRLLGPDRAAALASYHLTRAERKVLLSSKARSLPDLARDCGTALGNREPEADIPTADTLVHSYGIKQMPHGFVRGTIERLLNPKPVLSEWSAEHMIG